MLCVLLEIRYPLMGGLCQKFSKKSNIGFDGMFDALRTRRTISFLSHGSCEELNFTVAYYMTNSTSPLPIALVTGASSGLGKACAKQLHKMGFRVYGASRFLNASNVASGEDFMTRLPMNVDDDEAVSKATNNMLNIEQRIDVVVNCAGFGIAGAIEDTSIAEAKAQFETNFFGLLRVCRAVLPTMRRQQSGLIVNMSSLVGLTGMPFQGLYTASKYAIEGLTESLRMEVAAYGVRVVLIEPGDFATGFTQQRQMTQASTENSPYAEACTRAIGKMVHDETHGLDPLEVGRVLDDIICTPRPRLRYVAATLAQRMAVGLKPFVPHSLYERMLMHTYGM